MGHNYTLFFAAKEGKEADIQWVLFKKKTNPNIKERESGKAPLHFAVDYGHTRCASVLLQAGAKVNARTYDGMTPLHLATYAGHEKCVMLLLQAKADVNAKSRFGSTALHQAAYFGHHSCAQLLLQHGANVDAQENWGLTPLMLACQKSDLAMVQLLLSCGASVDIGEKVDGKTALHFACEMESPDCAAVLLDVSGDPNVIDYRQRTPLHTVLHGGLSERLSLLLVEYGANPYLEDGEGETLMGLLEGDVIKLDISPSHRDLLLNRVTRYTGKPRSLTSICRHAVRKAMGPERSSRVGELPIPKILQQYLSFGKLTVNQE